MKLFQFNIKNKKNRNIMFILNYYEIEEEVKMYTVENQKIIILIENTLWIFDFEGSLIPNISLNNIKPFKISIIGEIVFIFGGKYVYYFSIYDKQLYLLPNMANSVFLKDKYYFSFGNRIFTYNNQDILRFKRQDRKKELGSYEEHFGKHAKENSIACDENKDFFSNYNPLFNSAYMVIADVEGTILNFCFLKNILFVLTENKLFYCSNKAKKDEFKEINSISGFNYIDMKYNNRFIALETTENIICISKNVDLNFINKPNPYYGFIIQKYSLAIFSIDIQIYSLITGQIKLRIPTTVFSGCFDCMSDTSWLYSNIFYELKINNRVFLKDMLQKGLFKLAHDVDARAGDFYFGIYTLASIKNQKLEKINFDQIENLKCNISALPIEEPNLSEPVMALNGGKTYLMFKKAFFFIERSECKIDIDHNSFYDQIRTKQCDCIACFDNLCEENITNSKKGIKFEVNLTYPDNLSMIEIKNEQLLSREYKKKSSKITDLETFEVKLDMCNNIFHMNLKVFLFFLEKLVYKKKNEFCFLAKLLWKFNRLKKLKRLVKFSKDKFKIEVINDMIDYYNDRVPAENKIMIYNARVSFKNNTTIYHDRESFENKVMIYNQQWAHQNEDRPNKNASIHSSPEKKVCQNKSMMSKIRQIINYYLRYHDIESYIHNLKDKRKIRYLEKHVYELKNPDKFYIAHSNLLKYESKSLVEMFIKICPDDTLLFITKNNNFANIKHYFSLCNDPFKNQQPILKALKHADIHAFELICSQMNQKASEIYSYLLESKNHKNIHFYEPYVPVLWENNTIDKLEKDENSEENTDYVNLTSEFDNTYVLVDEYIKHGDSQDIFEYRAADNRKISLKFESKGANKTLNTNEFHNYILDEDIMDSFLRFKEQNCFETLYFSFLNIAKLLILEKKYPLEILYTSENRALKRTDISKKS